MQFGINTINQKLQPPNPLSRPPYTVNPFPKELEFTPVEYENGIKLVVNELMLVNCVIISYKVVIFSP